MRDYYNSDKEMKRATARYKPEVWEKLQELSSLLDRTNNYVLNLAIERLYEIEVEQEHLT